jgi:hypothetical protein
LRSRPVGLHLHFTILPFTSHIEHFGATLSMKRLVMNR